MAKHKKKHRDAGRRKKEAIRMRLERKRADKREYFKKLGETNG